MMYAYRIPVLVYLCIGALVTNIYVMNNSEQYNERTSMSNQSGQLMGKDKQNNPVIIVWQKMNMMTQELAEAMASVWDMARPAYVPVELGFLKAFPGVVGKEPYFKAFEPLFANGVENVDWKAVEELQTNVLKSHFVYDLTRFSPEVSKMFADDACYFVSVKDGVTQQLLGFITILVRKAYAQGDVKIMSLAVDPAYQNRGLGKMLMGSVLKVVPHVQRIHLCTRVTNDVALRAYRAWGFVIDPNPVLDHPFNPEHWIFMHYRVDQSTVLQDVASQLA